ncbi:MAG: hypothetical protein AAB455_00090 [Patescibacteria group bacterium]
MLHSAQQGFARLRELIKKKDDFNESVIEIIFQYSGIKLEKGEFTYRDGMVRLKTSPLKRNQIILKQKIVLENLNANLAPKLFKRLG